jgi:transcriptional activator protein UGA3
MPRKVRSASLYGRVKRSRQTCFLSRPRLTSPRKKKCDGALPTCRACHRLNFACRRQDPRQSRKPGRPRKSTPAASGTGIENTAPSPYAPNLAPDVSALWLKNGSPGKHVHGSAHRRLALRYYTQALAVLVTTTPENNCFLSVFLPLAMESPLFLEAILAWSTAHLAVYNDMYRDVALTSRNLSLSSLATAIQLPDRQPEMELGSCLVQCAIDSITGDTRQWYTHLVGAHAVIRTTCYHEGSSGLDARPFKTVEGRWLLSSFAYHDIMMAVVEDRTPLLVAGHYWFPEDEPNLPDTYVGLGSTLLYIISQTCVLNVDMMASREGPEAGNLSARAQELESRLNQWSYSPHGVSADLINLAEMYRSAALIHLYRVIRRNLPGLANTLDRKISAQIEAMFNRLKAIPQRSFAESSMLFPLFMAGGEAEELETISIVRDRMSDIAKYRKFSNVKVALEVLEEVWRLRQDGQEADWRDVLGRWQWILSIT